MNRHGSAYWMGSFVLLLCLALDEQGQAAPRRPTNSASACSISADKFNQLAANNPSGAQACRNMADNAQAHGSSFAFMCDAATGEISCCNDSQCVTLGAMVKSIPPGQIRPIQPQGNLQTNPNFGTGTTPIAPPPRTSPLIRPRGIEGSEPPAGGAGQ